MLNTLSSALPFGARATADAVLAGLDLAGRTIVVTGCNTGLGFETMRALAAHGAHVLGLARTEDAARAACAKVGGQTTPFACDNADLQSVLSAIDALRRLDRPLDAIVANAGVMGGKFARLYGIEKQFWINHVAHFLLVTRLLDRVPDETGRIVVLSSSASIDYAPRGGIMFDNLDGHRRARPLRFYGQSKLANALFARELARRLASRGIAANAAHPGVVFGTRLMRGLGPAARGFAWMAKYFGKSVAEGAATQVMLAASPVVDGITGQFWSDCRVVEGSPHLKDAAMAARLWDATEEILARALAEETR